MAERKNSYSAAKITLVGWPPTSAEATKSVSSPVSTSRPITTTRPSFWSPTATRLPSALMENCLGMLPPAGNCWIFVSAPDEWSISKVKIGSDVISVLLAGSKLGIFSVPSPREDTSRNLLSGCEQSEQSQDR